MHCIFCAAKPPKDDTTLCKAFQFCRVSSKSIEVLYENMDGEKILTKVNFQLNPVVRPGVGLMIGRGQILCVYVHPYMCMCVAPSQNDLREEVVEKVKWQVNRDSAENKLRDFLEWMYAVKKDTRHHVRPVICRSEQLHCMVFSSCRGGFITTGPPDFLSCSRKTSLTASKTVLQLPFISSCRTQRYYLLLFITLLLNLFLLITFAVPETFRVNTMNDILKSV